MPAATVADIPTATARHKQGQKTSTCCPSPQPDGCLLGIEDMEKTIIYTFSDQMTILSEMIKIISYF
jgi:hypothetical protein